MINTYLALHAQSTLPYVCNLAQNSSNFEAPETTLSKKKHLRDFLRGLVIWGSTEVTMYAQWGL